MDSIYCLVHRGDRWERRDKQIVGWLRQLNQDPIKNYLLPLPWRIFTLRALRALRLNQFFFCSPRRSLRTQRRTKRKMGWLHQIKLNCYKNIHRRDRGARWEKQIISWLRQINQKPIKNCLCSPPCRIFTLRSLRALRLDQFFFCSPRRSRRALRINVSFFAGAKWKTDNLRPKN